MWRCVARVGELVVSSVQLAEDADPDTDPELPQLAEVRWTDELTADQHTWPLTQGPSTAKLVLLLDSAADAAAITASTTVAVELYRQDADTVPVATFHGRASDPVITPHELGVMVELTCGDYLSDLAADTVGASDYPSETTEDRVHRLFDAVGQPRPKEWLEASGVWVSLPDSYTSGKGPEGVWPMLAARSASATSLLAEAQATLAHSVWRTWQVITEGLSRFRDPQMYELRPHLTDGELDPTIPWQVVELDPELEANAPLRLVLSDRVWTAEVADDDPDVMDVLVPAEYTSWDATWARRTVSDVNTVDVVLADQSVVRSTTLEPGERRVTDRRETQLTGAYHPDAVTAFGASVVGDPAKHLGDFLLPDRLDTPGSSWEADRFTVELDRAGAPADWWPGELREVRTVSGVQPRHSPEGRSWWTGVVAFREVSIAGGECRVELGLLPRPLVARTGFDEPFRSVAFSSLPTHPLANRMVGPGTFDGGVTTGWLGGPVAAVELDPGLPGVDGWVGRYTINTTGGFNGYQSEGGPAAPGEVWTAVVWVRNRPGSSRSLRARVRFRSSTGSSTGSLDSTGDPAPPSGPFVRLWATLTAPAATAEVEAVAVATSGAVGDEFDVAAAMVVPGDVVPTEYVDATDATVTFANIDPSITLADMAQVRE